jgi:hypothetical protein
MRVHVPHDARILLLVGTDVQTQQEAYSYVLHGLCVVCRIGAEQTPDHI